MSRPVRFLRISEARAADPTAAQGDVFPSGIRGQTGAIVIPGPVRVGKPQRGSPRRDEEPPRGDGVGRTPRRDGRSR